MSRTQIPSKLNKLRVGDKVIVSPKMSRFNCERIVDLNCIGGKGEIPESSWPEVYFWLHHQITQKPIEGKVIGFGGTEDDNPRLNVHVRMKLGKLVIENFFHEKNLKKVKK